MNAAMSARPKAVGEMNRTIRVVSKTDGERILPMGNFTYERVAGDDGPMIITIIDKADRLSKDAEPVMIIAGVILFEVDPKPKDEMSEPDMGPRP